MNTKQDMIASKQRLYIKAVGATQAALIAVRAVKHRTMWGNRPARLYAANRGVSPQMWRLVQQAEAIRGGGVL